MPANGKRLPISRQELYELVWSQPMIRVAERFAVSGSYMARVCDHLNVPRPQRGYWAKHAVGKAPPRIGLPDARPGDPLVWAMEGEAPAPPRPRRPTKPRRRTNAPLAQEQVHPLVREAPRHFERGWPADEGDYLKPYKKLMLDVTASRASLNKALAFANELFKALEAAGHRVMVAPANERLRRCDVDEREVRTEQRRPRYPGLWSPGRPTVTFIDTVAIGLSIIEMSEAVVLRYVGGKYVRDTDYVPPKRSPHYVDHTWTTTRDVPSGRLRLVAYSPYWRVTWSIDWQETSDTPLDKSLSRMVKRIENSAAPLVEHLDEAQRRAEIAHRKFLAAEERRQREEDRRKIAQSIADSQDDLGKIIQNWAMAVNIERFFSDVEARVDALPEIERHSVLERLELARKFLGTQDPLSFFMDWKTPSEHYCPRYETGECGVSSYTHSGLSADDVADGLGNS